MGVSVVIPAYNAATYLGEAIASAQHQSQPPSEIIVIDDCSRDGTVAVVRAAMASDPSIRLLQTARNGGPGAARNLGLAQARGEWIALLDADDTFSPERLALLETIGRDGKADLVSDNLLLCPVDDPAPPQPMYGPGDLPAAPFTLTTAAFIAGCIGKRHQPRKSLGFMQPLLSTAFLRRHAITYIEDMRFGEDFMLYLACLLAGANWTVTPRAMYRYRIREGSLTERQAARDLWRLRAAVDTILRDPATKLDEALATSARRYRSRMEHEYFYRAFTDAIKSRNQSAALRVLLSSRTSVGHILSAGVEQTPTILRKALSGGYLSPQQTSRPVVRSVP